jgi:hypothetical protein
VCVCVRACVCVCAVDVRLAPPRCGCMMSIGQAGGPRWSRCCCVYPLLRPDGCRHADRRTRGRRPLCLSADPAGSLKDVAGCRHRAPLHRVRA